MAARIARGGLQGATGSMGGVHQGVQQVMDALTNKTRDLWGGLFEKHKDAVFRYYARRARTRANAEDLVQATFLEAALLRYKLKQGGRDIYRPKSPQSPNGIDDREWRMWLMAISRNLAMRASEQQQRAEREQSIDGEFGIALPDLSLTPDEIVALNDRQLYLHGIVTNLMRAGKLSAAEREVLDLRFGGGLSHEEIAEVLSRSSNKHKAPDAVRKMYSRALAKIKAADTRQEKCYVNL